ncbi:transposase [Algoriphagus resistens]|uniref:transposase n=1 Tax=Algoriphagus resistens TaxID=1750590 RepID=UPI0009EB4DA5
MSITCEVEHKPYGKTGKSVGIDTGIKELAVLSDGSIYENIRSLKTKLKKLRFGQRQLSKKTKGSRSRGR